MMVQSLSKQIISVLLLLLTLGNAIAGDSILGIGRRTSEVCIVSILKADKFVAYYFLMYKLRFVSDLFCII